MALARFPGGLCHPSVLRLSHGLPAFRALLLDFDGTLVDSLGVLKGVYTQFLKQRGKTPTDQEFDRINGPPLTVGLAMLREAHGLPESNDELLARYLALVAAAYEHAPPAPGAVDLIKGVRARGWATAIVTSNTLSETQRWLKRWALDAAFDAVIGGDCVQRGKPNPDPYLAALERLECEADLAVAVEDTATGIRAATGAFIDTWALDLQHRLPRDVLDLPHVLGVADNLRQVAAKLL